MSHRRYPHGKILAMAQSLGYVLIHVVFSVRERRPVLREDLRPDLFAYLATVVRDQECECFRVGGVADHVHLAIRLARTITVAKLVAEVKSCSSRWLKERDVAGFAWQNGYGVFSVGPTDLGALVAYIDGQEAHHAKVSYQEEYRAFLKRYGVEFDERYVWD